MRYGLPYMGSKNQIARQIVDFLPPAKHFYDLFCGGCAVSHAAMLSGKYETVTINDILGDMPKLFLDAMAGKSRDETRWISREEFNRLKDSDAYIRCVWSFGSNGRSYLYSEEIEPWKKALHYARVFRDTSLLKEFGIASDGSPEDIKINHKQYKAQYVSWYVKNVLKSDLDVPSLVKELEQRKTETEEELREYLRGALRSSGLTQADVDRRLGTCGMAGHYFSRSQWEFPTRENYNKMREFMPLNRDYEEVYGLSWVVQKMQNISSLSSLDNLNRRHRVQSLQHTDMKVKMFSGDYQNVEILPDSVVYCDPPYYGTAEYKDGGFDHRRFWDWIRTRNCPVYVSEYAAPEDFISVWSKEKTCSYSSTNNSKKTVEHIFLHKRFAESLKAESPVQLELELAI